MNIKSKILLSLFVIFALACVGLTYFKLMVKKDYVIEAQASCDPSVEKCFVAMCDPSAEECTGNVQEDTSYYKIIHRNAENMPLCNPEEEGCEALVCPVNELGCEIIFCDEEKAAENGTTCSDPEIYTLLREEQKNVVDTEENSDSEVSHENLIDENSQDLQ
jgi:hypothetical protein